MESPMKPTNPPVPMAMPRTPRVCEPRPARRKPAADTRGFCRCGALDGGAFGAGRDSSHAFRRVESAHAKTPTSGATQMPWQQHAHGFRRWACSFLAKGDLDAIEPE